MEFNQLSCDSKTYSWPPEKRELFLSVRETSSQDSSIFSDDLGLNLNQIGCIYLQAGETMRQTEVLLDNMYCALKLHMLFLLLILARLKLLLSLLIGRIL